MLRTLLIVLISLAVIIPIWLVFADVDVAGLESNPDPVGAYAEARAYVEAIESRETDDLRTECRTLFLDHGRKTGKAVVYFHGLTSCPEQFRALGEKLYERGCNVWIVRLPHHGLKDPHNTEQAELDAEDLTALTDRVVDVGTALADTLIVVGLSAGGVMAAWAAQHRKDLDRTVLIAPCFAIQPFNKDSTPWLASTALSIPNFYWWWHPLEQGEWSGPKHVYPRFASHGLGEVLRLGLAVKEDAGFAAPAAKKVLVITNEADNSVDNRATEEVVERWRAHTKDNVTTFEFSADLELVHDMIDPAQPGEKTELVHPLLVELILGG